MSNSISLAKDDLLKGLRKAEQEVRTIKELLATIEAVESRSDHTLEALPVVRKDEFRGKRAIDALDAYLRARRGSESR